MAFQVSPGVLVKEIDLTNVVPAVATSIGAIAGAFQKGPMNEIIPIGSEQELVSIFGKPNSSNFETWFTAANFLQYGNALRVVRANTGARNAIASGGADLLTDTGDGSTTDFTLSQSVSDADLLLVTVDGTVTTAFSVTGTTLSFDSAPANSAVLDVKLGLKILNDTDYDDTDMVNHPPHYNTHSIECIEAMKAMSEGAELPSSNAHYCWQNAFKYLWRHPYKTNQIEDLKKCEYYLKRLINEYDENIK